MNNMGSHMHIYTHRTDTLKQWLNKYFAINTPISTSLINPCTDVIDLLARKKQNLHLQYLPSLDIGKSCIVKISPVVHVTYKTFFITMVNTFTMSTKLKSATTSRIQVTIISRREVGTPQTIVVVGVIYLLGHCDYSLQLYPDSTCVTGRIAIVQYHHWKPRVFMMPKLPKLVEPGVVCHLQR